MVSTRYIEGSEFNLTHEEVGYDFLSVEGQRMNFGNYRTVNDRNVKFGIVDEKYI